MSRTSGVVSSVHIVADIHRSLEAFDGALKAMMDEGLVKHSSYQINKSFGHQCSPLYTVSHFSPLPRGS